MADKEQVERVAEWLFRWRVGHRTELVDKQGSDWDYFIGQARELLALLDRTSVPDGEPMNPSSTPSVQAEGKPEGRDTAVAVDDREQVERVAEWLWSDRFPGIDLKTQHNEVQMRASERAIEQAIEPIREYARTLRRGDYPTIDEAAEAIKRAERIEARADELQSLLDTPPDPDGEISVARRDLEIVLDDGDTFTGSMAERVRVANAQERLRAALESPDA